VRRKGRGDDRLEKSTNKKKSVQGMLLKNEQAVKHPFILKNRERKHSEKLAQGVPQFECSAHAPYSK
jgi:hypothetical protein